MSKNSALIAALLDPPKRVNWGKKQLRFALRFLIEIANYDIPKDFVAPEVLVDPLRAQELAWEKIRTSPKWQALLQRVKKRKQGGKRLECPEDDEMLKILREACALREFFLAIIKANPCDRIPISPWLRRAEEVMVTEDNILCVYQDMFFTETLAALCFRNKEFIRLCPICQRIFVADRTNKQVCSKGCRVRKSRQLHLDTYLVQEARRAEKERLHYREGQLKSKDREVEMGQVKAPFKPHVRKPRRGKMKSGLTP